MFIVLQTLGVLLFLAGVVLVFHRRRKQTVAVLCVLTVISAGIANMVLGWIPMTTEQITLTARGEHSAQAKADEVVLVGIISDGKTYEVQNAVEGKWFWQGNQYMWRNEGDTRQPKGTTRSITLNIPIGAGRALVFNNNPWRGMVDITFRGQTQICDLYCEKGQNIPVTIPDTAPLYDNMVKLGRLALFGVVVLLLMAYPIFIVFQYSEKRIWQWLETNWDKLIYIFLALGSFAVMFSNGDRESFWVDEVWSLGWIYGGYPNPDANIFLSLYDLWFHLMPYGQKYLLIISELFSAACVYMLGMTGRIYKGKRFGLLMAALSATSFPLLTQGGSEFRPYAMMIFSVSALTYFFIKRHKEQNQKISTSILYMATLALAIDTHPFSLVVAGLIMIFDFGLILLKRVRPIRLLELVLPGVYGLYKLYMLTTYDMAGYGVGWGTAPSIHGTVSIIKYLCNDNTVVMALFLIGIAVVLVSLGSPSERKRLQSWEHYTMSAFLAVPVVLIALVFLYSLVFNGATMFVDRYFVAILPMCIFFSALALDGIFEVLITHKGSSYAGGNAICILACILILCVMNWHGLPLIHASEDFRGTAEYIMSQNDVYKASTICVVCGPSYVNEGFEYYLTQKGKRDPINHKAWTGMSQELTEYETIYFVYHHSSLNPSPFLENGYIVAETNNLRGLAKFVKG